MQDDKDRRYNVTLGPDLDDDLEEVSKQLQISKSEAMRRALTLFKHAVLDADSVNLVKDGNTREVLIR